MGEWVKIAAAGTATTSGTVAPGNVTGLNGSYRYTDPNSNNERQLELIVEFTPPSPLGTFIGVAAYYEDLDQSDGGTLLLDGTTDLDGTYSLDGEWNPKPGGRFTDSPAIIRINMPIVRQRKIRVYLVSYSTEIENDLARATSGGPSPNVLITVDPFGEYPAGIEYVPLGKNFTLVGGDVDYSDYSDAGARMWSVGVTWAEPDVDPRYDMIGGYVIVLEYPNGHRERPSGFLARTQLSWQSDKWPVPTSAERLRLWLVTFRTDGRENSIVHGVTPMLEFTVQPQVGSAGVEYTPNATGFSVLVEYSLDADGSEIYRLKFTWTPPTDPRFGGLHFVYDDGSRRWGDDYSGHPTDTTFTTGWFPVPSTGGTFDIWAVAIDRTARENTIVNGTTPKATANVTTQTTGKIPGNRLDPTTLHGSLAVALGKLAVAAGGITTDRLANLAVEAAKLATGAVIEEKIFDGAVGSLKLANLAVVEAKIANGAVTSLKIGNAAVGSAAIANLAVGTAHIQDLAVTNGKIANLDVGKLTAGTMTVSSDAASITVKWSSASTKVEIWPSQVRMYDASNNLKVRIQSSDSIGVSVYDDFGNVRGSLRPDELWLGSTLLQVLGPRMTGWTEWTGTSVRTSQNADDNTTVSDPPTQAEVQAIADRLRDTRRGLRALISDLHSNAGHGLIGT